MSSAELAAEELMALVQRVFQPRPPDRSLAVLVDLPDQHLPDNPDWKARRSLAAGWVRRLQEIRDRHGLDVHLVAYRNVRTNNADLPDEAWLQELSTAADSVEDLRATPSVPLPEILREHQLVLAPTELSATAPLKVLAPQLRFRAATMPGFSPEMVPALRLDYVEVNRRVVRLKRILDEAVAADLVFEVDGSERHRLHLDLRHRSAHASGGLLLEPGTAGNLPSGEAYIVPYEGEREDDPTTSEGTLPVQMDDAVVVFEVRRNRAVRVLSEGPVAEREAQRLTAEPAYGNLAELGLGVLADMGIEPIGEVLLDEKLGLHLAFGRSEHFGGQVGPRDFSAPEAVVHQDHVYIPQLQPRVQVRRADLAMPGGQRLELMQDGRYLVEF